MATKRLRKAIVSLGGVPLSGISPIAWKFQTGVVPYVTTFSVHWLAWKTKLKPKVAQPLTLVIVDPRGVQTIIRDVYILHTVPSDSSRRVSFVVSDKRWKWSRRLVVRDYNVTKKSGDRTFDEKTLPVEQKVTVDEYDFKKSSLKDGKVRWQPKDAVMDVLDLLEGDSKSPGKFSKRDKWIIESFPIEPKGEDGQFTMQNVLLRDSGDVALARLLAYIPGAEVYIDKDGKARVIDGADLKAAEAHFNNLPVNTRDGDYAIIVDRKKIRPSQVLVYYEREVEILFEFEDDYSGQTSASPDPTRPYIENVVPTVDPKTTVTVFDPDKGESVTKDVPPGTWIEVKAWLDAMNKDRPVDAKGNFLSSPWTFDTIKLHWFKGELDAALGNRGQDIDEDGNIAARVSALKENFRQTFRISERYMNRIRDIRDVRAALLDPVTGKRAPAAVWGQACLVPSTKGNLMAGRKGDPDDPKKHLTMRNVDYLAKPLAENKSVIEFAPGPTRVNIIDKDLGIFKLQWLLSPYGTVNSYVPSHIGGEADNCATPRVPTRNLAKQDKDPTGTGYHVESAATGLFLCPKMKFKALMTIVPSAPNNKRQFHVFAAPARAVATVFRREFGIKQGFGPPLEVYVQPGEATARFAWADDVVARDTLVNLLGLNSDDPNRAGLPEDDPDTLTVDESKMNGFTLVNGLREIAGHAIAVAAEQYAAFADSIMGRVTTRVPEGGRDSMAIKGNMSSATISVEGSPSAKVSAEHEFPGRQKSISRFSAMSEDARRIVLGIVPFK